MIYRVQIPQGSIMKSVLFFFYPEYISSEHFCFFKAENRSHDNLIHTQSIWISTRFNILEIPSMQLDISMGAAFQRLILLMISSLEVPLPLFLLSGLNWPIIPETIGSRSEFIKQPTLPSYYWLTKWFVILSNSFSMLGQRYCSPVQASLTVS